MYSQQELYFYDRQLAIFEPYWPHYYQSLPVGGREARVANVASVLGSEASYELQFLHQLLHLDHVPISRFLAVGCTPHYCQGLSQMLSQRKASS